MNNHGNKKINKYLVYTVSFMLITVISIFYKLFLGGSFDKFMPRDADDAIVIRTSETVEEETEQSVRVEQTERYEVETTPSVSVYICGEVNSPGVYSVEAGSIINDVVELAGGFTQNASTDRIDLVYILDSNLSVYIPSIGEICEGSEIIRAEGQTLWGPNYSGVPSGDNSESSVVNINTASVSELMALPGIGEATANAIIEYREQQPFSRVEDIMNVSGIGQAKFDAIRELIGV
ncbi:MAG: helix-hairpin-helix domain-containing protein [Clostridiales bacterium]|nr:helix-hairpin-helix domain-containing protein [Clostridiales bacterium]